MRVLFENIKLFFIRPKQLFLKLKEAPNVKLALFLLFIIIFFFQTSFIKAIMAKYTDTGSIIFAFISSLCIFSVMITISLLVICFYTLLLCRLFGSKPSYNAVFASLIYCRIPNIISGVICVLMPVKLDMYSILQIDKIHPFFMLVLQVIGPFSLWVLVMEIIAISTIAGISYFRSFFIVFSYLIIGVTLTYLFGFKPPVLS